MSGAIRRKAQLLNNIFDGGVRYLLQTNDKDSRSKSPSYPGVERIVTPMSLLI
jgi:hypothetical protein